MNMFEQENFMKDHILLYFESTEPKLFNFSYDKICIPL